jgi:RNase P subunit RPR2
MEKIALEIARLNETLKMIVSIAKEEIRKSEELSKKYEEERKKMKKYKVTLHERVLCKS